MRCPICNKDKWKPKYDKLLYCTTCGFIRAKDKYFKLKSSKIYTQKYFKGTDYLDYEAEQEALTQNFRDRLKKILRFKKSGKLLEIGCAYGYFLKQAKSKFKTFGIDLDPLTTKNARIVSKSKIYTGDFLKLKIKKGNFDIVCMFDVIEHLKSPGKYIRKISEILKPGGLIVIETGDIDGITAKIRKSKWRLITPPFHLQYFSKKTLIRLLEKNKFVIKYSTHVSFFRTFGQTIYRLRIPEFLKSLLSPLRKKIYSLNTFDLIFIIAQKK